MQADLSGKVSLVTGAARNIGAAIAHRLAANGSRVIYADCLDPTDAASQTPNGVAMRMDVTNRQQIEETVAKIVQDYGRLDILVNNAGVNVGKSRVAIDEFPREEWDRIVAVDMTGVYEVSQVAARVMKKQQSGRIINISSAFGLVAARLQCAFVAAKAGVVNLTKAMALELGPHGILVNGVAPGSILTEGTKEMFYGEEGPFNNAMRNLISHIPLGRPGTSDEIAVAVLFLADPENTYTNGHMLAVDGGWTAGFARDF